MAVQIPEKFQQFRALVLDPTNEEKLVGYLKEYSAGGSYTGAYFNELTSSFHSGVVSMGGRHRERCS